MKESMFLKLNHIHPKFTVISDAEMTEILMKNNIHGSVQGYHRMSETDAFIEQFVFHDNNESTARYISNFKDGWSFPILCTIQIENENGQGTKGIQHTMYLNSISQVPVEQLNIIHKKYVELEIRYNECNQQLQALQRIPILGEEEIQKLVKEIERLRKWQTIACKYFPETQTANIILLINEECK